jgi:hypothetical protein
VVVWSFSQGKLSVNLASLLMSRFNLKKIFDRDFWLFFLGIKDQMGQKYEELQSSKF